MGGELGPEPTVFDVRSFAATACRLWLAAAGLTEGAEATNGS